MQPSFICYGSQATLKVSSFYLAFFNRSDVDRLSKRAEKSAISLSTLRGDRCEWSKAFRLESKLTKGEIPTSQNVIIDLRKIQQPIIVLCSLGDNITPPQQALNWIADLYKDEREIKSAG